MTHPSAPTTSPPWPHVIGGPIKTCTITPSLMMRKLGAYPSQSGLAIALRELGRIERTLFLLDWLENAELRRTVTAGLNKGEARNTLAGAVFFNRLGEIRDRSFEQQRYRATGLERAIITLGTAQAPPARGPLRYLSPLSWEHINLTGNYTWPRATHKPGRYRALRHPTNP